MIAKAERALAAVAALALYALNDVRLFQVMPRDADPGNGRTHATAVQVWGASEQLFLSNLDLALRWGLAGLTIAACIWALAETLKPAR
ncbi:MAG: hypothetical protein KF700_02025 [Hyphomonadaceae bacterium]|nr:hypothetical protein [Hyphomonadaceae bacterium]